jgi:hypothetical protein
MKGALHKVKKAARSNFITEGLLKRKASTDSWGEEIPTSQETQDGVPPQVTPFTLDLEAAARAYAAGAAERNDDDDDDDDGNDSDSLRKAAAQQAHDEETYEALVTSGVITPEIPISAETGTPPNVPGSLPDPNLTPRSPRVAQATEAELYKLRQTAILEDRDRDHDDLFTAESIPTPQFQTQIDQAKAITGDIVDENIRGSSPILPEEPWTFGPKEVKEVREAFQHISRMFGSISPHMSTNPELLAEVAKDFLARFVSTEWADVKVHGSNIKDMFRIYHKYEKRVRIEVPDNEMNASAPGASPGPPSPPPTAEQPVVPIPTVMEVDPSPPRIPAALKGKGKAVPTPPPAKEAVPIKPASPIKISAVPRQFPAPQAFPAHGWKAKLDKKSVYDASSTEYPALNWKGKGKSARDVPSAQAIGDIPSHKPLSDVPSSTATKPPPAAYPICDPPRGP